MVEKDDDVEMEVRIRHPVVNEDSSLTNVTDDSTSSELVHVSASVRRLLSDESFHAPKQDGTVRIFSDIVCQMG